MTNDETYLQGTVRSYLSSATLSAAVALLSLPLSSLACGGDGGDHHASLPDDDRRNVMVIDDGIDPASPALAGKIAAQYTVDCPSSDPAGRQPMGTLAQAKAQLLEDLSVPDNSCQLLQGINAKPAAYPQLSASVRDQWNDGLRHDQPVDTPPLSATFQVLSGLPDPDVSSVHGTTTSGVIAYNEPDLRMVLVQQPLADPGDNGPSDCIDPAAIALATALYSDPDIHAAIVRRPQARVDSQLAAARAMYKVGLVNESFGTPPRVVIEQALAAGGCPAVALGPYFALIAQLQREVDDAHPEPGVLIVKAAGNDGVSLASPQDHPDCRIDDPHWLTVGSYDITGTRSTFSNFGPCVDVYAPGERILGPVPGDLWLPESGTSLSTPMLLRMMLTSSPGPFTPETARAAVLALRAPNRNISIHQFDDELIYDPDHLSAKSPLLAGSAAEAAPQRPRFSARALERVLGPLRWAARHPIR